MVLKRVGESNPFIWFCRPILSRPDHSSNGHPRYFSWLTMNNITFSTLKTLNIIINSNAWMPCGLGGDSNPPSQCSSLSGNLLGTSFVLGESNSTPPAPPPALIYAGNLQFSVYKYCYSGYCLIRQPCELLFQHLFVCCLSSCQYHFL